jgi:pimeloyl-ACP methyl ester carboxylesterase
MSGPTPWHEPRSRRLELPTGITCHALEWDEAAGGSDHTVILVHGFLDTAWSWVPTVSAGLAERFHVLAPEMRGHGDSDRIGPGGYYHFLDYVADLHAIIERAGKGRVSLVGHSMGGTIAGYYAGAYPDTIARLALLEGLGPPEPATQMPERLRGWIAGWRRTRGKPPRAYASIEAAAEQLRARDRFLDETLALELAARSTTCDEDGSRRFKHDPLHLSTGPYPFQVALAAALWRAICSPVLLIDGGESEFSLAPADRARRVGCFGDVRERVLPRAGHMMQRHQPCALAALLLEFL